MAEQVERVASIDVELVRQRETRGTVVYTLAGGGSAAVTTIYVLKWAVAQLGDPDRIVFTLTAVSDDA